jgi:hypothetical protein
MSIQQLGGGWAFRRLIGKGDGRPTAILFRQIATPNYELRSFLRTCRRLNFDPVILTYHRDRMSCHNSFKRALIAPAFIEKINRRGQPVWRKRAILNVEELDRKRLCEIEVNGRPLPEFHDLFLRAALQNTHFRIVEGSDWFGNYPNGARDYYTDLFLGLRGNFVLVEDFDTEDGMHFFAEIVRPAFDTAKQVSGVSPYIMRLNPGRFTNSPLWYAYPDYYRAHLAALGVTL